MALGKEGNGVAAARAQALAEGIKSNESIMELKLFLYGTKVGDEGAKARPPCLERLSSLCRPGGLPHRPFLPFGSAASGRRGP